MAMAAADQASYNYCALPLASYACRPDLSAGRLYEEPESETRTCFQRDRDRIIHASAFRRLKYKTQVFIYHEGDHFRTRLTHTLEVSQIARTLARALLVNEDLAETIALAHDLGHTPFAHVGEDVLSECMEDVGGFDHNDQSFRVLTELENKYPRWRGLNLTWETLEGVAKHNGPMIDKGVNPEKADLPPTIKAFNKQMDLRLSTYASLEAQVAAIADDIAYNNHDVEDGLSAHLFTLEDLKYVSLLKGVIPDIEKKYPDIAPKILIYEIIREMIGAMVVDVITHTEKTLSLYQPAGPDDVRNYKEQTVGFSSGMGKQVEELRTFLWEHMYRHHKVRRMRVKVSRIVKDLYEAFMNQYQLLPDKWQLRVEQAGGDEDKIARARVVADYIAGMTDRFAVREHEKIFDLHWGLK
jgi:dGTPase